MAGNHGAEDQSQRPVPAPGEVPGVEREGPLTVERHAKEDGRALIRYVRVRPPEDGP